MAFDSETIEKRYNELPSEVQNVLTSPEIAESITKTGEAFGLHVDQIGLLFQETTYFLLGLENESQFESNIIGKLDIDRAEADKIIVELNQRVFLPIRDLMKKDTEEQPRSSASDTPEEPGMNKSDILAEIENPTPVEHPISIAKEVPAFPMAREITPEQIPTAIPAAPIPEKTKEAIAHDFIAEKLTGTVNIQPQQPAATAAPEKIPEKPKAYVADPYREPLV